MLIKFYWFARFEIENLFVKLITMNILFGLLFTVALALPVEKNSENKGKLYDLLEFFSNNLISNL